MIICCQCCEQRGIKGFCFHCNFLELFLNINFYRLLYRNENPGSVYTAESKVYRSLETIEKFTRMSTRSTRVFRQGLLHLQELVSHREQQKSP